MVTIPTTFDETTSDETTSDETTPVEPTPVETTSNEPTPVEPTFEEPRPVETTPVKTTSNETTSDDRKEWLGQRIVRILNSIIDINYQAGKTEIIEKVKDLLKGRVLSPETYKAVNDFLENGN